MTHQLPKVNDRRVRNNLVEIWTGYEWIIQKESNSVNHPLTDEILEQEQFRSYLLSKDVEELWHTRDDMRAAADWQLEQVIEWIRVAIYEKSADCFINIWSLPEELKEAMRPPEDDQ